MKKICTIILSITLSIFLITEVVYYSITRSITEKEIQNSVQEVLINHIDNNNSDTSNILDEVVIPATSQTEMKEIAKKVLETKTGKHIITEITSSIYEYNLTGNESKKYTEEELIKIVTTNFDEVLKEMNYSITESEKQEIINYVKEHANEIINKMYTTNIGEYLK